MTLLQKKNLLTLEHDIKNQCLAIATVCENIARKEKLRAKRNELMAVAAGAREILKLLNSLLHLDSAKGNIHIKKVIQETVALEQPLCKAKNLSLMVRHTRKKLPSMTPINSIKLRRILINLIDNALKFTNTGSIKILTTATTIKIIDNGPGLNHRLLDFINHDKSPPKNIGTGLITVKSLVRELNASIAAKNGQRGGACFILNLEIIHDKILI